MHHFLRAGRPAFLALALMSAPAFAQDAGTAAGTAMMPAAPSTGAPAVRVEPGMPQPAAGTDPAFPIPKVGGKGDQVKLIAGLCGVQMKQMSEPACTCLAEQALKGLSDPQRDYLIATVVAPPVADRMLNDGRVGQPDQEAIFRFISATAGGCATGTFDAAKAKAAMMPATPMLVPVAPAAPAAPATPTTPAVPAN